MITAEVAPHNIFLQNMIHSIYLNSNLFRIIISMVVDAFQLSINLNGCKTNNFKCGKMIQKKKQSKQNMKPILVTELSLGI